MLKNLFAKALGLEYENRILIYDPMALMDSFQNILKEFGFQVWKYEDVEASRNYYEKQVRLNKEDKFAFIADDEIYVPYDIASSFKEIRFSLQGLFPKLNEQVLQENLRDLELIAVAYSAVYENLTDEQKTRTFIDKQVFSQENVRNYTKQKLAESTASDKLNYREWIDIAKLKARILYYASRTACEELLDPMPELDAAFEEFIQQGYNRLSSENNPEYPVILPKFMQSFVKDKTALIVMDGMSCFDFEVLSRHFEGIDYDYNGSFALIPTVTSISRQSLMAGKYPQELENPFSLSKEEKVFLEAGKNLGYRDNQMKYSRGYTIDVSASNKLLGIIVNEVDDIMHGQRQGRLGMYNDLMQMGRESKLENLIKKLTKEGYQVYITADHGNTVCIGKGNIKSFGVETQTRSHRMLVLKDFGKLPEKAVDRVIEYPGYYMDKAYQYYVCKKGESFDNADETVVTHGGITLEEVIVPFIKIKGAK